MLRILSFLLVVLVIALGFSWLQDHPGTVAVNVGGSVLESTFTVFVVIQLAVIAIVCFLVWLVRAFFKTPDRIGNFFTTRRRDKGYHALSSGIIAAGAGDAVLARRMTKRSAKLLTARKEPLVRFLDAQTAMIEGDHARARSVFQQMESDPDTRLLAMRGLYLEAERLGDASAARHYAERAARIAPHVPWAGGAVLESKAIEGDYDGAIAILEAQRDSRLVEKADSTRLRAVLLTAKAKAALDRDPAAARKAALEAVSLSPSLVPAATIAARASFRLGDVRKGSRILEKAWTQNPHPEIAQAYIHARPGDSAADRLTRARTLASLQPTHVETHIALAHAALDAGDLALARLEAKGALEKEPREAVFLLLADLEEAGGGSEGAVREWLGRAVRAARDPAWTADGIVAEEWAAVSPVSGRLDAFEWKVPSRHVDATGAVIEGERAGGARRPIAASSSPDRSADGERLSASGGRQAEGPAAPEAVPAPNAQSLRPASEAAAGSPTQPANGSSVPPHIHDDDAPPAASNARLF